MAKHAGITPAIYNVNLSSSYLTTQIRQQLSAYETSDSSPDLNDAITIMETSPAVKIPTPFQL